jgi:hypothetical protein
MPQGLAGRRNSGRPPWVPKKAATGSNIAGWYQNVGSAPPVRLCRMAAGCRRAARRSLLNFHLAGAFARKPLGEQGWGCGNCERRASTAPTLRKTSCARSRPPKAIHSA